MSTPRGGRGGERGRGARGNPFTRGAAGRGRGNGAPTETYTERPVQQVYTRGGSRGANRGGAARGNTTTTTTTAPRGSANTRANTRGRANHSSFTTPTSAHTGGLNSTPYPQDDYAKRLDHIRAMRPKLREQFIKEGRMNPEGQMRLCDSVKLFGLCTDMCPEYERVRRIVEEDVKPPECTPETEHLPRKQRIPDETRMVKAYARSAAGMDVELVSEIRSPATCLKTLDYLLQRLDNDEFDFLHSWIWDRTRAVRKDLRTQRIEHKSDINILLTCLERSARFFLLSAHQMSRTKKDDYSHQQDIEQLNQTFMSLNERYKDNERINLPSENEPEFYAYRLILAPLFNESQFENDLHTLRPDLRNNPRVKTAVEIYRAIRAAILEKNKSIASAQANSKRLWDMIKSPRVSYLMACAAEISFERVRHNVIDTIWHAYRYGNASHPQVVATWTVPKLREALGYDKDAEAVQLCEAYGFEFSSVDGGPVFLDVSKKGFQKTSLAPLQDGKPQIFSQGMVEQKRKDRAFSAIVQAMSVEEAQRRNLMSDSSNEETIGEIEDETSLFVPEAPAAKPTVFTQSKTTFGNPTTTNPFLTKTSPNIGSVAAKPNPFLSAQPSTSGSSVAKPNPFLPQALQSPFGQAGAGPAANGTQPGLFNASKDPIKFGPSEAASTPFGGVNKPNPFPPTTSPTPANPTANAVNGPLSQGFTSSTPAAASTPPLPTFTPPTANTSTFVFPGLDELAVKPPSATPSFSFTPAGSPAPAPPTAQDTEKQKAEEDARRRKAEADAKAQRQREQQELARRAEQQRVEAEKQRQRLKEEERNRQLREAQELKQREEEARMTRVRARENGYDALAADIMFDVNEGLMMQFVENLIHTTACQAMAANQEEKREKVRKKQEAVADAMYEQRTMGLLRMCMFKLVTRNEKKKRDQKARDRRRRLKEQKAKMAEMEVATSDMPTPAGSDVQADQLDDGATFRKPHAPASARRAKRTEERRGTTTVQQNGDSRVVAPLGPPAQPAAPAVLTPISMNSSRGSNGSYSESYRKSTAPIDRTDTDWFTLRAEGFDPSTLRKRNFDDAADEDEPDIETKRPKMAQSSITEPPVPQTTTTSDRRARLEALEQKFRKSTGSPQLVDGASSFNGRSSLDKRSSVLIEQARQVLGRSRSTKASSPNMQHDYGRSVPSLHRRTMSAQPSVLGRSVGATQDRAAYWNRPSRFVPKSCYGQGPDAIRDYRVKYGLSSPANTRPNSTEPLAVSSPVLQQMSCMPVNGYTQEQYSEAEESSGIEIVDVDAEDEIPDASGEDEDVATTEEEYEGDEESDDDQDQLHRQKSHPVQVYDQDDYDEEGDSPMQDGFTNNGYVTGQYADEALVDYDGYTDEDADSDEESDEEAQFTQRAIPHFTSANAKKPAAPPVGGNTEDDAIELSD